MWNDAILAPSAVPGWERDCASSSNHHWRTRRAGRTVRPWRAGIVKRTNLQVVPPSDPPAPAPGAGAAPRGRMMDALEIAAEKFSVKVTEKWVRATVPGKMRLSHNVVVWYERDVDVWLEQRRRAG